MSPAPSAGGASAREKPRSLKTQQRARPDLLRSVASRFDPSPSALARPATLAKPVMSGAGPGVHGRPRSMDLTTLDQTVEPAPTRNGHGLLAVASRAVVGLTPCLFRRV